jgi:hypothetical protein
LSREITKDEVIILTHLELSLIALGTFYAMALYVYLFGLPTGPLLSTPTEECHSFLLSDTVEPKTRDATSKHHAAVYGRGRFTLAALARRTLLAFANQQGLPGRELGQRYHRRQRVLHRQTNPTKLPNHAHRLMIG